MFDDWGTGLCQYIYRYLYIYIWLWNIYILAGYIYNILNLKKKKLMAELSSKKLSTCWRTRLIIITISFDPASVYRASSPENPIGWCCFSWHAGCSSGWNCCQWDQNSEISSGFQVIFSVSLCAGWGSYAMRHATLRYPSLLVGNGAARIVIT